MYSSPYLEDMQRVWNDLQNLIIVVHGEGVVVIGDFNQVEIASQKLGGTAYIRGRAAFSDWKFNCQVSEVPFFGASIRGE